MKNKLYQSSNNEKIWTRRTFLRSTGAALTLLGVPFSRSYGQTQPVTENKQPLENEKITLGMVIFDGFQLLDVFGPLDMFGSLRDRVRIVIIGEKGESAKSSAGPVIKLDYTFQNVPRLDIVMIPGGGGTRREVNNIGFITAFKTLAEATPNVASICTGAAVLAKTGLLDGLKATTNKKAFKWATSQRTQVNWVAEARWVEDGKYFTSSGISAGMDMALALIAKLFGKDQAIRIANGAEYEWKENPDHDPFAKLNGLVR